MVPRTTEYALIERVEGDGPVKPDNLQNFCKVPSPAS